MENNKENGKSQIRQGRKRTFVIIIVTAIVVSLLLTVFVVFPFYRKRNMIECTLEWGRLAPFPREITDFKIVTEGTMFTRSFRATFTADPAVIEKWLNESPGTRGVTPESAPPNKRILQIMPGGGGALGGWVIVNDDTNEVEVYIMWS